MTIYKKNLIFCAQTIEGNAASSESIVVSDSEDLQNEASGAGTTSQNNEVTTNDENIDSDNDDFIVLSDGEELYVDHIIEKKGMNTESYYRMVIF